MSIHFEGVFPSRLVPLQKQTEYRKNLKKFISELERDCISGVEKLSSVEEAVTSMDPNSAITLFHKNKQQETYSSGPFYEYILVLKEDKHGKWIPGIVSRSCVVRLLFGLQMVHELSQFPRFSHECQELTCFLIKHFTLFRGEQSSEVGFLKMYLKSNF